MRASRETMAAFGRKNETHKVRSVEGDTRWTAVAITMDGHGVIAMDGSSSNGQWRRNGRLDGKAIAMGNERALAQWTAQWMADNCH